MSTERKKFLQELKNYHKSLPDYVDNLMNEGITCLDDLKIVPFTMEEFHKIGINKYMPRKLLFELSQSSTSFINPELVKKIDKKCVVSVTTSKVVLNGKHFLKNNTGCLGSAIILAGPNLVYDDKKESAVDATQYSILTVGHSIYSDKEDETFVTKMVCLHGESGVSSRKMNILKTHGKSINIMAINHFATDKEAQFLPKRDLAMIHVLPVRLGDAFCKRIAGCHPAEFAEVPPKNGDVVYLASLNWAHKHRTKYHIEPLVVGPVTDYYFQVNINHLKGCSGSPVFNMNAEVVGILSNDCKQRTIIHRLDNETSFTDHLMKYTNIVKYLFGIQDDIISQRENNLDLLREIVGDEIVVKKKKRRKNEYNLEIGDKGSSDSTTLSDTTNEQMMMLPKSTDFSAL